MGQHIEIIPYETRYHMAFKKLNLEWLDKYNLTESHDLMVLDDPIGTILNRGGFIWLARSGEEIIGTAALMKEGYGIFELAKMSVTSAWQGKGVSKLLLETCIKNAKKRKASKLTLFSNHQLTTALALYQKYGFRNVELKNFPFVTADIKMELDL